MTVHNDCTAKCCDTPDCLKCGKRKKLIGRDYPAAMGGGYCDHECSGYREEPYPGHLWWSEWRDHDSGDHGGCMHVTEPTKGG